MEKAFLEAVEHAVPRAKLGLDGFVCFGTDPEDGGKRVELHLFDRSREDSITRRDIETRAIRILLDIEDDIPGVDSIAFVHAATLDPAARLEIESRPGARIARFPRESHRV